MTSRITLGDQRVEAKDWSLNVQRDYVAATMFGIHQPYYLPSRPEISGSFSSFLDPNASLLNPVGEQQQMKLYVPKAITRPHAWLHELLRTEHPQWLYAEGPISRMEVTGRGQVYEGRFSADAMTLHPDPGTLPHVYRVRLERWLVDVRYRLWDRFLRPTVVIDQDEWQADEYEAHEEELHYAAMEQAELADAYGVDDEA